MQLGTEQVLCNSLLATLSKLSLFTFNLIYSFDLSSSPFSCLPEFADTVEA